MGKKKKQDSEVQSLGAEVQGDLGRAHSTSGKIFLTFSEVAAWEGELSPPVKTLEQMNHSNCVSFSKIHPQNFDG